MGRQRLAAVDGLRGVAILAVCIFHGWTESGGPPMPLAGLDLAFLFALGAHGATLFFAISGFCLTLPIAFSGTPVPAYGPFLRRRFGRLVPPYYAALVLWVLFWQVHPRPPHYALDWVARWPLHLATHAAFVHTFWVQTFFSLCGALWFVGILAQCYLLFPLLVRVVRRWPWPALGVSLGGLALWHTASFVTFPLTRLPFFVAGMVAATVYARSTKRGWPALQPVGRLLELRPLQALGRMSYSLLLYNFIGFQVVRGWVPGLHPGSPAWWLASGLILLAWSVVAYRGIELPLGRLTEPGSPAGANK